MVKVSLGASNGLVKHTDLLVFSEEEAGCDAELPVFTVSARAYMQLQSEFMQCTLRFPILTILSA